MIMTQKQKDAISRGLKLASQRRRRSTAMKQSWARRKFDVEQSKPNAIINAANESLTFRKLAHKVATSKLNFPQVKVVATFDNFIVLKVS